MTADELEEQVRAAKALTHLRLAQEQHDRLFGAGSFKRDSEALMPVETEADIGFTTQKLMPPEAVALAIARTN